MVMKLLKDYLIFGVVKYFCLQAMNESNPLIQSLKECDYKLPFFKNFFRAKPQTSIIK